VSVFLGDSDPVLLRELQGVAERELQRFFDEENDAADAN
jgi:hypothetical protein